MTPWAASQPRLRHHILSLMSTFTPDRIYCAINGLDDGTIVGIGGPFGDQWTTIHDASRPADITIEGDLIPRASDQDTLKESMLTGAVHILVHGCIYGGAEDCVDVTRCHGDIVISARDGLIPTGKHVAIVKGESSGVTLYGLIRGHGKDTDIELGGFYGGGTLPLLNGKTTGTVLNLSCADPIKIRQFRATDPVITNGQKYKHDWFYELVYPLWLWFREKGIGK